MADEHIGTLESEVDKFHGLKKEEDDKFYSLGNEEVYGIIEAVELLGVLAGNFEINISLVEARRFLKCNFQIFLRNYALHDLAGVVSASLDTSKLAEIVTKKYTPTDLIPPVLPEYLPYLRVGLTAIIEDFENNHHQKHSNQFVDVYFVKSIAKLLSDTFLDERIEEIVHKQKEERSEPEQKYYILRQDHTILAAKLYAEAWKSGPVHIHTHEDGNLYHPKEFRNPCSDDHKQMELALRMMLWDSRCGSFSWKQLERAMYEALNKIIDIERYTLGGRTLEECTQIYCPHFILGLN